MGEYCQDFIYFPSQSVLPKVPSAAWLGEGGGNHWEVPVCLAPVNHTFRLIQGSCLAPGPLLLVFLSLALIT